MRFYELLFPLRGSIASPDPKGLNLEVTNFGFLRVRGVLNYRKINVPTWILAKDAFELAIDRRLEKGNIMITRYQGDSNTLRFFGVPGITMALFKRSELEPILNEK